MPNRRDFVVGCSAAIAAMSGAQLTNLALAAPGAAQTGHTLVVLFLRGGWDALNVMTPLDGPDRALYEQARPGLKLARGGKGAALGLNAQFGLHPSLAPLHDLYSGGQLALVTAVGTPNQSRSHFDAQEFMEQGTAGERIESAGWLTRFLASAPGAAGGLNVLSPAFSVGGSPAASLRGQLDALALQSPSDFRIDDDAGNRARLHSAIEAMYQGDSWLHRAGQETVRALRLMASSNLGTYKPGGGARYPDSDLGRSFATVAQMLKAGLGLRVATLDYGGWDTHEYQGDGAEGHFADQLDDLGRSLRAFWDDLSAASGLNKRVTVVTLSEFGRRLQQNASGGTDHGHGSLMTVLGGGVHGGKIYGRWPGLAEEQLFDHADLAVTTDYRQVLSELVAGPMGNPALDKVFPGFKMGQALGLV